MLKQKKNKLTFFLFILSLTLKAQEINEFYFEINKFERLKKKLKLWLLFYSFI